MSIVALKRKVNARSNISKRQITSIAVPSSQPGPNVKRGLVARTSGTVVNNHKKDIKSYNKRMENPVNVVNISVNNSHESGFSINGKKNINGNVQKDKNMAYHGNNISCCSDTGDRVKPSVLSSKGMIQTKKYRTENCCRVSDSEKYKQKQSVKKIENMSQSSRDVILRKKQSNVKCDLELCGTSPYSQEKTCSLDCKKAINKVNKLPVAVSHEEYTVQQQSITKFHINQTEAPLN